MTVAELIEVLRTFPHDRRVVVYSYEAGLTDIGTGPGDVREAEIALNVYGTEDWYMGPHDLAPAEPAPQIKTETAVILGRAQ